MKKEVFRIVRRYRKCFAILATKHPTDAMYYWYSFHNKTDGVMSLFAADNSISCEEYMLVNRYLESQWQRLFNIYCI